MSDNEILDSPKVLKQQIKQLGINCDWLLSKFFILHRVLNLPAIGAWQDTVEQVVEHVKKISKKDSRGCLLRDREEK